MESPSLSACMIVKNEERMLPSCLESIRDHVDEIILVDTGSTDNTVSIAESYGAKVFHHVWEDHFSRHRNQSIGYAGGDWIFIIDADEELARESGEEIKRLLGRMDEELDALTAVVESPFSGGGSTARANSIRFFRNHRGITYQGRVHNYLVGARKAFCSSIRIVHHGYHLEQSGMQRKFERTTRLLRMDIEEDPSNPRPHHFLAASYLSHGLHKEAAREALEAVRLFEQRKMEPHNYLWSLYIAASACLEEGQREQAEEFAARGLEIHPDHLDSHYVLAEIAFRKREPASFHLHMTRYLETSRQIAEEPSRFGEMVHNTFTSRWRLHLLKGVLSLEAEKGREAHDEFAAGAALSPDPFGYHFTLGRLLSDSGKDDFAIEEFEKSLRLKPEDPNTLWILSSLYARNEQPAEQVRLLEKLLSLAPEFPNAHFQAGLGYMRLGQYTDARSHFKQARVLRPDDRLAVINEALCLRGMGLYEDSLRMSREVKPASRIEEMTLLLNRACCHDQLGQEEQAIESFAELEQIAPEMLDAPVYLSRLLLKRGEMEACVAQCDRLLNLLRMNRAMTLQSLTDLGALYFEAAERLKLSFKRKEISTICYEISLLLGYHEADSLFGSQNP